MEKTVKLGSIFLVCFLSTVMCSLPSSAVDSTSLMSYPDGYHGTILYVGGSGPGNYTTIQEAINVSSQGDTVFVYGGFYSENVLLKTSVSLVGEDKNTTIIDGGGYGTVVTISADSTLLKGFTVQNAQDDIHSAGIEISPVVNVIVTQNIIQHNGWFGVSVHGSDDSLITIEKNTIRNNSYGVYLLDSPQATIEGNDITNNGEGVYIIGSEASFVSNNTIVNRGLGLHVENSYGLLVAGNWIVNNANGVYVVNSSEVTFEENTIGWNRWYGIWLKDTYYCTIDSNSISDNIDVGLFLESSYDTNVTNNILWDNDNGIYLKDSAGNIVSKNSLRNNKMNACFVAHTLLNRRNLWRSNFWERALLFPYPILGIIKMEKFSLSCINFDWTPLRQPLPIQKRIIINDEGKILYVGGNGPNNYSSIQNAIDDAQRNDTVYVFNGTYYESVLITKALHLTGENKTTTILEGNGTRDIVTIIADYVTVRGFTIQDGHFNILVNHSSFGSITGNTIGSGLHGVSVQNGCRLLTISKNTFEENVYGIRLFSSTETTISYNVLSSFKINAFYFGTALAHGRHHWDHNYWGQPRFLPYLVFGKIRLDDFSLPWLNVDWSPLRAPTL